LSLAGRDADSIRPIIKEHVAPGTIVKSDGLNLYKKLPEDGFHHAAVIHDDNLVDPYTGVNTNLIEGTWPHAKNIFPRGGIGSKKETHAGYLNQYAYERMVNYKYAKADPFLVFLRLWGEVVKISAET
jgi:transposase-like protein